MAALDTNVLVRYLVRDDEKQWVAANKLIASALRSGRTLHVPITVMLELEWVLRSGFGFDKQQVMAALAGLLSSVELSFGSEDAVEVGLALYLQGSADFADCVHAALAHAAGEIPLWTFDKAAAKVEGARLLGTSP